MRKQLLAAGIVTTVGVAGVGGVTVANAQTNSDDKTSRMSSLVQALSTKFNLKESEVQSVVDSQRAENQATREAAITKKVEQLVSDGKLTQDQADAINAKRAELTKERKAAKDSANTMTRTERKTAMDTKRTELEAWAKRQGIDTEYLRFVAGGPGGHGHGGQQDKQSDDTE